MPTCLCIQMNPDKRVYMENRHIGAFARNRLTRDISRQYG
jgi:hypothetical protein